MSLSTCFSIFARSSSPYEPKAVNYIPRRSTIRYRRTIFFLSFEIHSCGEHAFRTNRPLNFELIFRRSFLHEFRLEDEAGVPTVCGS